MISLWQQTAPVIHVDEFSDEPCDTVVVGAGLTGLTTAVLLARAGQRVTLLEARTVGAVTTGKSTGKLSLLQGSVLGQLRERAGDETLQAYVEANREGQAWLLRELESRGDTPQRRPAFTYVTSAEQLDVLERELNAANFAGINAHTCDSAELPLDNAGALRLENQAQLNPMMVLAILAAELRERGGRLVEHCRVRDVETDDHGVRVVSTLGTLAADRCVLATGSPILDRGMFFAKLKPSRSFTAAYRLGDSPKPHGMFLSIDEPERTLRTATDADGEELLIVGGPTVQVGTTSDAREHVRELDTWARQHFDLSNCVACWGAQDYRTFSYVPFAGELPRGGGRIFTATGFNKWGMSNAVAASLAIVSEILGGQMEWARTLYRRTIDWVEMLEAVGENAAVAARLVSGWATAELAPAERMPKLAEGEGMVVRERADPVGISCVNGHLCRVSAVCTHLGGILRWNTAEQSWDCPLHGSRFSSDGSLLEGPAVENLSKLTQETAEADPTVSEER